MMTSTWSTYAGPGRIALSPAPAGVPRGYRLAPRPLRLLRPMAPVEVRAMLLDLDARSTFVQLHRLVYPWVPVLMGDAFDPACTYRRIVADWLQRATGAELPELDPETYHPKRADFREWRRFVGVRKAA